MRFKYFSDTDTALVEFTDNEVFETKELDEGVYVYLDGKGSLVSMTIEHARSNARPDEFSLHEVVSLRPADCQACFFSTTKLTACRLSSRP